MMKKGIAEFAPKDKRNMDGQKNIGHDGRSQAEALSLILSRLQVLEEKIDRIDHQIKNHWASSIIPNKD